MCELFHSPINLLPMQSSKNKHYILEIEKAGGMLFYTQW